MKQMSLGGRRFEKYGKTSRRAQLLGEIDCVVPWAELCEVVEPYYPKGRPTGGRPALELMLRIHFLPRAIYAEFSSNGRFLALSPTVIHV